MQGRRGAPFSSKLVSSPGLSSKPDREGEDVLNPVVCCKGLTTGCPERCMCVHIHMCCAVLSRTVMSDSLCPWDSPGKNTGMGCHALFQGIFLTQGSNPGLPYCRQILYHLSHQESSGILEWVADPFCKGTSWPRNQTRVSCIAGRFFTSWATQEACIHT